MVNSQNDLRKGPALDIAEPVRLFATYYPAFTNTEQAIKSSHASHVHHFFEILYFESGSGSHTIDNIEYQVEPGDLFVIMPGQLHNARGMQTAFKWIVGFSLDALSTDRTDADIYFNWSDELLLLSFLKNQTNPNNPFFFKIKSSERNRWEARFREMGAELEGKGFGYREVTRALLILLLTDIARKSNAVNTGLPFYDDQARSLLVKVFRFIETHYTEPISLNTVAKAVGLSPAYLTDRIRRETGRAVVAWITERRMADARKLLIETEATVSAISKQVGYQQSSNFIRQFKQVHAVSPQVWRQSYRN